MAIDVLDDPVVLPPTRAIAHLELHSRSHSFEARASRLFWLFPLNSEFFLEALHYMRRSDQDWIFHEVMPAALRSQNSMAPIEPLPDEIDALARIARLLQQRGIEVRIVIAPYAPVRQPTNTAQFIALIESRTGLRVWNYVDAVKDLDGFADTVHLNERGSRELLAMLVRDGAFGMARTPARL